MIFCALITVFQWVLVGDSKTGVSILNINFKLGKKAPKIRSIPLASLVAYNETNSPLPVGAAFCFSHLKSMEARNEGSDFEKTPMKCSNAVDDLYIPEAAIISNESLEESTHVANSLCEALVASPLTFQIKEKKVADLSDGWNQTESKTKV